jgi:hypothetical protein
MPGHSRSKDGVASARLFPGIHVFAAIFKKDVDGRDKPGHDDKSRTAQSKKVLERACRSGLTLRRRDDEAVEIIRYFDLA